ncbi:Signal transduction histidine kinase [Plantibacter flavus]|uniref:histidine kinase n=1 Tax=Plantibacter flavus TaxID=150123 RepID=A0A3N2C735_9MICO|nr:HAMP domain-containing sensor histidine kinase [Plantibacter flavus]ROR83328.1 signal transduction histidine kinase [Plantibacter flavus]SMG22563.1 Signal transduction histidine kinase [Plantibacter flavus]
MRRLRALSIRARITLGSVLVAAVLVSAAAFAMHQQLEQIVHDSEVTLAEGDLASFAADIRANPSEAPDDPAAGILVSVRAPDGSVPVDTMPHDIREVLQGTDGRGGPDDAGREGTTVASDGVSTVVTDERVRFTVVGERVSTPDGEWQLWAARSGAGSDLTVEALDRALLIGAAVLVVVFGVAAWALATAALRPVNRMRRTAESLGTSSAAGPDVSEDLLPVGPAEDELAQLARTLNAFISRTRAGAAREREMVSAASHELRTPIAVLTTQLELAHRSFGDADALEQVVREAQGSLHRLAQLAANLLELSRLDAHPIDERATTARALESEVMEAVDRGRLLTGPDGPAIEFSVDLVDDAATVGLSSTAFSRVLDNLLANAISATPPAGSVRLGLRQTDHDLVLTVTDTGRGFPDAFVPHAFERFSRPDEARDAASGGSGLGLALVAAIARSAGGTARIDPETTQGAAVVVALPVVHAPNM